MSVAALNVNLALACKFDETAGSSIFDWKGQNTGTQTSCTLNQTGPGTNKAILFNGSTSFIRFLNSMISTDLNVVGGQFSIEVWFKTASATNMGLLEKAASSTEARVQMKVVNTNGGEVFGLFADDTQDYNFQSPASSLANNAWHQAVFVMDVDAPSINMYIDGTLDYNDNTSPFDINNIGDFFIGQSVDLDSAFNGYIALPRWWDNRTLSQSDVTELWNSGAGLDLFQSPTLTLRTVIPSSGLRGTGSLSITNLRGTNLNIGTSPVVKLKKTGETDITATSVVQVALNRVTCTVDLTGVAGGVWDVYYQDSTGNVTLAGAFTVNTSQITSITPFSGTSGSSVSITNLAGTNLAGSSPVVKLKKTGQSDINCTSVVQVSDTQVTCTAPLTGAVSGAWDIFYQDSAGSSTLAGAFIVVASGTKVTCDFDLTGAQAGLWDVYYSDDNGNDTLAGAFEVTESVVPGPLPIPEVSPSIPSDSLKHVLNSARFVGSTVLDTTNETGKERLNSISTFRDTILSVMKATSKTNVHINTSAGLKLKAVAALNPNTATAADIVNAVKNA